MSVLGLAINHFVSITPDGQLNLPSGIQEALGLHPGSHLALTVDGERIILRRVEMPDLDDLYGILAEPGSGLTDGVEDLQRERRNDRW